jgi:hypothetical protein
MPSVGMTAFITHCWQKRGAEASACLRHALALAGALTLAAPAWPQPSQVETEPSAVETAPEAAKELVKDPGKEPAKEPREAGSASSAPSASAPATPSATPSPSPAKALPAPPGAAAEPQPKVGPLELRRRGEALELSVRLRFDLPEPVRDALYKGLSVIFTAEVEIFRERWWWFDARVSRAQRQWRLVYQPLTQRWRLSLGAAPSVRAGGAALAQTFDSLDEALAVIQHIAQWPVADADELKAGDTHRIEFHFHLDTDKLPRPLQLSALGDEDWDLDLNRQRTFRMERLD